MPKRTKKQPQTGAGIKDVLSKINDIAKSTKIISRGLGLMPNPLAQGASAIADQLGYGRKRVKGHRIQGTHSQLMHGAIRSLPNHPGSQLDVLQHPAGFVIGSSVKPPMGRSKHVRARVGGQQRGGGFFSDLGGGIGSVFGGLGSGIGSVAHGIFG